MTNPISEMASSIDWAGATANIAFYVGWGLAILLVVGFLAVVYYLMSFKISAQVFEMYGSGKDGIFSVGKPKRNKFKWIKNRTAWKALYPLFNKKEIEPFSSEYIYPGNKIYAFKLDDCLMPGRINIFQSEDKIRAEISPVPFYVRNWQSLQHKKHAEEFAKHDFWSDNKYFFMVLLCAGVCLVMVCVTAYLCYKMVTPMQGSAQYLADAINNFGVIK